MLKKVFRAERALLPQMLNEITREITRHVVDGKLINRLKVCAEEILVNIIDYAYPDKPGDIEITCEYLSDRKALRFEFVDNGELYNPLEQKPDVDIDAEIDERSIGGLGIFLYTTIMDELKYSCEDGRNHLTTIKNLSDKELAKTRRKVGVLLESDFYEPEIEYYSHCFNEAGFEVHFLTRLWGQPELTFKGHEVRGEFKCSESFEAIDAQELLEYAAMIIPAGYASDRLRYTEDIHKLPPACEFLKKCFADRNMLKGIICHGLWLMAPIAELVRGRRMVVHNNMLGDAKLMGVNYVDEDVVVDGDLVSARTGGEHVPFAQKIIELLKQN